MGLDYGTQLSGDPTADARLLRRLILGSLSSQGFGFDAGRLQTDESVDKERVRQLNAPARSRLLDRAAPKLRPHEARLLSRIADGHDVQPELIRPELVKVTRRSEDELLFRWASLHWSIPVSSGYGRRLRFLVIDRQNSKLIGVIGLCDPVMNVGRRDAWIGWKRRQRSEMLPHVLDAFVVGAVPPYSYLLGGKLVASLLAAREIREHFFAQYVERPTRIAGRVRRPDIYLITTTSALGRSSLYNRVALLGECLLEPVGYTAGYGDFHFNDGLYDIIGDYASRYCTPTAKHAAWGAGFRNRREVIKKALSHVGLPPDWVNHGIRRQIFVIQHATNARELLCAESRRPLWRDHLTVESLGTAAVRRWLVPRSTRMGQFRDFNREAWRLWQ